jgi:uncharacterized protein YjdB
MGESSQPCPWAETLISRQRLTERAFTMKKIVLASCILAVSLSALAAPKLEQVLNIDKGTQKDWNDMADDGGWNAGDKWQGISPKNIRISHNRDTKAIISFEVVYEIGWSNTSADSPKKIRSLLEKYCQIKSSDWVGENVTEQMAEGKRCDADYKYEGKAATIHVTHK